MGNIASWATGEFCDPRRASLRARPIAGRQIAGTPRPGRFRARARSSTRRPSGVLVWTSRDDPTLADQRRANSSAHAFLAPRAAGTGVVVRARPPAQPAAADSAGSAGSATGPRDLGDGPASPGARRCGLTPRRMTSFRPSTLGAHLERSVLHVGRRSPGPRWNSDLRATSPTCSRLSLDRTVAPGQAGRLGEFRQAGQGGGPRQRHADDAGALHRLDAPQLVGDGRTPQHSGRSRPAPEAVSDQESCRGA